MCVARAEYTAPPAGWSGGTATPRARRTRGDLRVARRRRSRGAARRWLRAPRAPAAPPGRRTGPWRARCAPQDPGDVQRPLEVFTALGDVPLHLHERRVPACRDEPRHPWPLPQYSPVHRLQRPPAGHIEQGRPRPAENPRERARVRPLHHLEHHPEVPRVLVPLEDPEGKAGPVEVAVERVRLSLGAADERDHPPHPRPIVRSANRGPSRRRSEQQHPCGCRKPTHEQHTARVQAASRASESSERGTFRPHQYAATSSSSPNFSPDAGPTSRNRRHPATVGGSTSPCPI